MTNRVSDVPLLVAHRGYTLKYPENTLLAVDAAVKAGVSIVEVDIQFSKDGVPVLLHDADLSRVANDQRSIFEVSAQDLPTLRVGEPARFGQQYANVQLSLLSELFEYAKAHPFLKILLEVKEESIQHHGTDYIIDTLCKSINPVFKQICIISYDCEFLWQVKYEMGSEVGFILTHWDEKNLAAANKLKPNQVICNYKKIPLDYQEFLQVPWEWVLYEITDPLLALQFAQRGVQYIETMNIAEMYQDAQLRSRSELRA